MKTKDCKTLDEVYKTEKQHFEARQRSAVYAQEVERAKLRLAAKSKDQKTLFNFDKDEEDY